MFLAVAGALTFSASIASAQDQAAEPAATEQAAPQQLSAEDLLKGTGEDVPFHQQIKSYFIQGGPAFMSAIILCLILGLALAIERILYLSFAKTNTKKLVAKVEEALEEHKYYYRDRTRLSRVQISASWDIHLYSQEGFCLSLHTKACTLTD